MKYSAVLTVLLLSACLAGCAPEKEAAPPAAQESALSESASPVIPADSAALSRQALDVYGEGDGAEALRLAEKALAAAPGNYEALALKGLLTAFAGAPEDGAAMIGKALEIYPGYTQGHYDMALHTGPLRHGHGAETGRPLQRIDPAFPKSPRKGPAECVVHVRHRHELFRHAVSWLRKAAALEPAVRETAAEQDHFFWLHGDTEFEAIIHP